VIIDFDQESVDISIVDRSIVTTGTVSIGTDFNKQITTALSQKDASITPSPTVGVAPEEEDATDASGVGDNQLQQFIKEIRRMVRYYEERYDRTRQIEQIVLVGDESRIPSLAALMTDQLRLPVRSADLWQLFSYAHDLAPIPATSGAAFIAVAGLASAEPAKVFA
jgi:Tfp pilus assembly PilM family ATPase